MSNDTELQQQEVALALTDKNKNLSFERIKSVTKTHRPRNNQCTSDTIIQYGVPTIIVILIVTFFILVFIRIRMYANLNCVHTKGASCRGMW